MKKIWWHHRRVGPRLKAWPANQKGWAAVAVLLVFAFGVLTISWALFGPEAIAFSLPLVFVATFGATYWFLLNRSSRAPDSDHS